MKTTKLKSLIINNEFDKAFETFDDFFNENQNLREQLDNIQGQYNQVVEDQTKGIKGLDEIDLRLNQTRDKLLDFVKYLSKPLENIERNVQLSNAKKLTKSEAIQQKASLAVIDKGFQIIDEIYSELSCIFYKAKRIDNHINDYYVVQLLNQYQLVDAQTPFDEKLLEFFSDNNDPFVEINQFESGNPCYIIRDYVNGIDLSNLIERKIKLSLIDAISASITIAEGLKILHKNDITYSNFIPSQIIMDLNGGTRILPMNIFKTNRDVVTWKQLRNAVKYMSPEQLKQTGGKDYRAPLSPSCNQYSLGQIIFFMLNGESIFQGIGLTELYADRLDDNDTLGQIRTFIDTIEQKLNYYSIPDEEAEELSSTFISLFNQLIKYKPEKRFDEIYDFKMEMERLQYDLKKAREKHADKDLLFVQQSFEDAVYNNEELINHFYEKLLDSIALRQSFERSDRNILFYYSMKYLFNSISKLDHEKGLNQALTCLVQSVHTDIQIDDFEVFFEVLKNVIAEKKPDNWNDRISEAWDTFNQKILDAIDVILSPNLN